MQCCVKDKRHGALGVWWVFLGQQAVKLTEVPIFCQCFSFCRNMRKQSMIKQKSTYDGAFVVSIHILGIILCQQSVKDF